MSLCHDPRHQNQRLLLLPDLLHCPRFRERRAEHREQSRRRKPFGIGYVVKLLIIGSVQDDKLKDFVLVRLIRRKMTTASVMKSLRGNVFQTSTECLLVVVVGVVPRSHNVQHHPVRREVAVGDGRDIHFLSVTSIESMITVALKLALHGNPILMNHNVKYQALNLLRFLLLLSSDCVSRRM